MAAPPPISPDDAAILNRYLHHQDLHALAADCFPGNPDLPAILAFLARPDIAAWIDLYRSLQADALRATALNTLARILQAQDPLQQRLAATTIVHATRPDATRPDATRPDATRLDSSRPDAASPAERATDLRSPRSTSVPTVQDAAHPPDAPSPSSPACGALKEVDVKPDTASLTPGADEPPEQQAPEPSADRATDVRSPRTTSVPMNQDAPPSHAASPTDPAADPLSLDDALAILALDHAALDPDRLNDPDSTETAEALRDVALTAEMNTG